jgi:hypothetical protein
LDTENLRDWRGEATILPSRMKYTLSPRFNTAPVTKWCDIEVSRIWRCGNRGNVASVLIEKPPRGDFLPIVDGGFSLQYSPLLEYCEGQGLVLFCQLDVTGRTESDPAAETLARSLIDYVSRWEPRPLRKAVYVGDTAGERHLQLLGIAPMSYDGGKLSLDQVVIVGTGGGKSLAANSAAVRDFLSAGGHLLAVGLDEAEANLFLPFKVRMKQEEHIAAFFEPFGANSPFAGVSAADVHNRDPRVLPLVAGGATVVGNGVLATAENANVVFCQLLPYAVGNKQAGPPMPGQYNLRRTYRRASFLLSRILANMGVSGSTPLLSRISTPSHGKGEKRWLDGLYLDEPEPWDDPYRFFRW